MSKKLTLAILTATGLLLCGCQNKQTTEESVLEEPEVVFPADTATAYVPPPSKTDSLKTVKGKVDEDFNVLKEMENNAPEYYERLQSRLEHGFIVIDKSRMKLILYDKEGGVVRRYAMGCSTKFGTKHKKGDNRTPEGFFSVENVYNSTDWLYTDDEGKTSKKKGMFGPWFIRLRIPGTSQIGIHGTCAPWSVGGRVSHGCIRLTNDDITELKDLVTPGMPVIIIPGKRDREQNYAERVVIPYFSTLRYTEQDPIVLPDPDPMSLSSDTMDSDSVDNEPVDFDSLMPQDETVDDASDSILP